MVGFSIVSAGVIYDENGIIHSCVNPTTGEIRIMPAYKRCATPFTTTLNWGSGGSGAMFSGNFYYFPEGQEMMLSQFGVNDWPIWMMMMGGGAGFDYSQEILNFLPEILIPRQGTLDTLMIKLYNPVIEDGGGYYCADVPCPPFTFTVQQNGFDTALACTIVVPDSSTCSSSGSEALVAGDLLAVEVEGGLPALGKLSLNIR